MRNLLFVCGALLTTAVSGARLSDKTLSADASFRGAPADLPSSPHDPLIPYYRCYTVRRLVWWDGDARQPVILDEPSGARACLSSLSDYIRNAENTDWVPLAFLSISVPEGGGGLLNFGYIVPRVNEEQFTQIGSVTVLGRSSFASPNNSAWHGEIHASIRIKTLGERRLSFAVHQTNIYRVSEENIPGVENSRAELELEY